MTPKSSYSTLAEWLEIGDVAAYLGITPKEAEELVERYHVPQRVRDRDGAEKPTVTYKPGGIKELKVLLKIEKARESTKGKKPCP